VLGWVAARELKRSIERAYPLAEAAEARAREGRQTSGTPLLMP
jgi:NADPH:quinone reductase-like Zn-dependent oxidoreductase